MYLKNCDLLTVQGLKVLKGHKVINLECIDIKITVNDIIGN